MRSYTHSLTLTHSLWQSLTLVNLIRAHVKQKEFPLHKLITYVNINYFDGDHNTQPDFIIGVSTCAIICNLSHHKAHPKYIETRIRPLKFQLRIVFLIVNFDDIKSINDVNRICFELPCALIVVWSLEECAKYVENYAFADFNKSSASIQQKEETEFVPRASQVLTNVRSINKTDVLTLLDTFESVEKLCKANEHQLVLCPGLGDLKVKRLHAAFHAPFKKWVFENKTN